MVTIKNVHVLLLNPVEYHIHMTLNYACTYIPLLDLPHQLLRNHGLLLPGRVPGYSRSDIKLLPSSVSKRGIWRVYSEGMSEAGNRAAAYRTFCRQWKELLPSLVVTKPLSDLCWMHRNAHSKRECTFSPPPLHSRVTPNSVPIKAHYSFDYAQQVVQ